MTERSAASAGPPRELVDDPSLASRDRQLGPDRRRALGHARQQLDAVEAHADRTAADDLLAEEQRGLAAQRAGAGHTAEHGHARRARMQLGQHRVGRKRVRIGQQDGPAGTREVRHAADRDAVLDLLDLGMKRRHDPVVERRRPHRHGRAALDLAAVPDDAARAAADQDVRREHVVDALDRGLGGREMGAGGEHDREVDRRAVERGGDVRSRLERPGSGIRRGRQPARDAHCHGPMTIPTTRHEPERTRRQAWGAKAAMQQSPRSEPCALRGHARKPADLRRLLAPPRATHPGADQQRDPGDPQHAAHDERADHRRHDLPADALADRELIALRDEAVRTR